VKKAFLILLFFGVQSFCFSTPLENETNIEGYSQKRNIFLEAI